MVKQKEKHGAVDDSNKVSRLFVGMILQSHHRSRYVIRAEFIYAFGVINIGSPCWKLLVAVSLRPCWADIANTASIIVILCRCEVLHSVDASNLRA